MKKQNKYEYIFVVQGYYGTQYGWEDVTSETTRKSARVSLKAYRLNEPNVEHRVIQRRVVLVQHPPCPPDDITEANRFEEVRL